MKNDIVIIGIIIIVTFSFGLSLGIYFAPEERTVTQTIEIEKIIELPVPATNQDVYIFCSREVRGSLYSNWDGKPKVGTTPQNTKEFIDDCFNKLVN